MPIMMEQHTHRYIDKIIIAETRTKWHGTIGRCEHPDLLRISFQPEDQTGKRHFRATQTELKELYVVHAAAVASVLLACSTL